MEIKRIKLYINDDDKSYVVASELKEELIKYGFIISDIDYNLVISIGGDGTFLRMVKDEKFDNNVYYVGVNSGTLGFLQEIDIKDTKDFVKRLYENNYKIEELSIQKTNIICDKDKFECYSLNEIVIRKDDFSLLKAPIYVDDELLEEFTGDGLLISTSTGSTAYNMSFGGSIIYNSLKALSITPIAPLNNKVYKTLINPVIVPNDKQVKILPKASIFMMVDGKNMIYHDVREINTMVSKRKIKCLRMKEFHFIKVVHSKILEK